MPVCSIFSKLFYKVFSSSKLIDLLGARPVVGNLIVGSLVVATGVSVSRLAVEDSFSANQLCNRIFVNAEGQLSDRGAKVMGLSAQRVLSDVGNKMVACSYEIESASGSERKNFDVAYDVSETGLTANIEERKIKQEDLKNICEDESVYAKAVNFSPVKIELFLATSADKVYPAFRWRCRYYPSSEPALPADKPGEQVDPRPESIGINLDKFCDRNYGDKGLTKAAYHSYHDSNSWYCTNPNTTASFD